MDVQVITLCEIEADNELARAFARYMHASKARGDVERGARPRGPRYRARRASERAAWRRLLRAQAALAGFVPVAEFSIDD